MTERVMPGYRYEVVRAHGAGVYTKPLTYRRALRALANLVAAWPDDQDWELERVLELASGGRRYWLRRRGRWRSFGSDPLIWEPTDDDYAYWRERARKEAGNEQ